MKIPSLTKRASVLAGILILSISSEVRAQYTRTSIYDSIFDSHHQRMRSPSNNGSGQGKRGFSQGFITQDAPIWQLGSQPRVVGAAQKGEPVAIFSVTKDGFRMVSFKRSGVVGWVEENIVSSSESLP